MTTLNARLHPLAFGPIGTGVSGLTAPILDALTDILHMGLFSSFRRYLRNQRDYRHLRDLPDYLLADIGVTRMEIAEEMRQHPFRQAAITRPDNARIAHR